MSEPTSPVVSFPAASQDVLGGILREGAQRMLAQAIEPEVAAWIEEHSQLVDATGRRQVVRNGYLPQRTITTGLGPVEVRQPRVHDRRPAAKSEPFSSKILPPYLRKTKSVEELIPWLYLKGVSTGDFSEALTALLGPEAPGLSATTVTRLKQAWEDEQQAWSRRSLADKEYVYVWADGVHFNIRLEEDRQCIACVIARRKAMDPGQRAWRWCSNSCSRQPSAGGCSTEPSSCPTSFKESLSKTVSNPKNTPPKNILHPQLLTIAPSTVQPPVSNPTVNPLSL